MNVVRTARLHAAGPDPGRLVDILCSLVASLALVVLLGGWLLDVEILRKLMPAWTAMAPLTALLLLVVAIGSSQFYRRPQLANAMLMVAFVAGVLVLIAYFTGIAMGLDWFSGLWHRGVRTPLPELTAPDAAAAFMLIATALICMRSSNTRAHDFGDVVAATIVVICLQVLIAYTYNLVYATEHSGFRQIAPHSAIAVTFLAVTVVAHRPSRGIFAAMSGTARSALLLRRLLPITVICCLLVGLLQVQALRARVGGTIPDIVAWSMTLTIVVLALLLFVENAGMRETEVTVQLREQDLMQATAVAENASKAKSRFMSVISHELRTPLTAILGYADMLEAGIAGSLSTEGRKYVDRIRSSGWHLVGIIDAVLLYVSGRPAGEQVRKDPIDLGSLITEITLPLQARAQQKGITLALQTPDSRVIVSSERARLREVLTNIIDNSVKFTEHGAVTVCVAEAAHTVTVDIIDTGIGIDEKYLTHIWEPFEQPTDPHTREHGGLGLGMALSRLLCDQLGVPIAVRSKLGQGTTVTLRLPRARHEEPRELRLDGRRLLVVDDEMHVRRIMKRSLERYGAQVTEAADAREALQLVAADGIDAVVTDISMPGMNGIDLAREIASRIAGMPIVFVTGAELTGEDRAHVDYLGGRLLNKPFDMSDLARTVAALFADSDGATA